MLIFDYDGVAVVMPDEGGNIVRPKFTTVADIDMDSIMAVLPQSVGHTQALMFRHNLDVDGCDILVSFGDEHLTGLKHWIRDLQRKGSLSRGEGTPNYDVTDSYIELGSTSLTVPNGTHGFAHIRSNQQRSFYSQRMNWDFAFNAVRYVPHLHTYSDWSLSPGARAEGNRIPTVKVAKVYFIPVDPDNPRYGPMPTWHGVCMAVQYEFPSVVEAAPGQEHIVREEHIKLFGFTFRSFSDAFQGLYGEALDDTVLHITHQQYGMLPLEMEVKGHEGWRGLEAYVKSVIQSEGIRYIEPLLIERRLMTS